MKAVHELRVVVLIRRLLAAPDGARADSLLGHCDQAALGVGLELRSKGGHLTVCAAGPPELEDEVLRHALESGADRAVRVYDGSLEGVDYHGVARVLAATVRHVGFDLVLLGDRSEDEGQGAVGPAVAELLGVPHVTSARQLRVENGGAVVTRRDDASVRTLRLPLPVVVALACGPPQWPSFTLRDGVSIESLGLDDLGIQAPELRHRLRCVGRATPARAGGGATIMGRADELIARLRDERLLP